ncbi:MAG TPA: DNA gyrase C-terminal beta-propeller domain-containing protein, partial [Clostridia bacterium]|nr:DNA gyrase C-terminal beta-propeller domain-containing protein [Clostridia bacterium]
RTMGRSAQGVMGIRLSDDDFVIGMEILNENETILSITENGFGKRTYADEYTVQKRGGKGILNYRVTEKTGHVVGTKVVSDDDDILLISTSGIIIRMCSNEISILGRATQGVTLMRTDEENTVVSLAKIVPEDVGDDIPDKDSEIDPFDEEPEDEEIEENDPEDAEDDLE